MVKIWEAKRNKEQAKELSIIIPLVIYHGQQSWNIPSSLEKGMEKGLEIGGAKALSETAILMLTAKFGSLPKEIKEAISKADLDSLKVLVMNSYKFDTDKGLTVHSHALFAVNIHLGFRFLLGCLLQFRGLQVRLKAVKF